MEAEELLQVDNLLQRFVACLNASALVNCSRECGVAGEYEGDLVRRQSTPELALDRLYSELHLPSKFPLLYERLVLTFRWYRSEVNVLDLIKDRSGLNAFDLFGNPAGEGLDGLRLEIFRDAGLLETRPR